MDTKPSAYRADLDGLRGVAILLVLVYHFFPKVLPGGFTGVDIFFVISGFLITGLIAKDLQASDFSFRDFYARRVRRIFPALILVLIACLAFGWVSLLSEEYQQLGRHISASSAFLQSYFLKDESSYFDNGADTHPLLHLWSLAVEEQFYLILPVLLFVGYKFKAHKYFLVGLLLLSFATNILAFGVYPGDYYFYGSETRFWELLLGGAIALFPLQKNLSRSTSGVLAMVGVLTVLVGVYLIRPTDPYPRWWALMPTLGACLIILSGSQSWLNRTVLSNRILIWVGLISYPLYLWYWALLSFTRIVGSGRPSITGNMILIAISFLLAWITFKFVETPIRFGKHRQWKTAILCCALVATGLLGYLTFTAHGYPERAVNDLNQSIKSANFGSGFDEVLERRCAVPKADEGTVGYCLKDKRESARYVLVGDSKAFTLLPGILRHSSPGHRWMYIGNVPIISDAPEYKSLKKETTLTMNSIIGDPNLKVVLIATSMRQLFKIQYQHNSDVSGLESSPYLSTAVEGLTNSISMLRNAGKKVVFLQDIPTLPDARDCIPGGRKTSLGFIHKLFGPVVNSECELSLDEHIKRNRKYRQMIEMVGKNVPELKVVDSANLICDTKVRVCAATVNGSHLYSITDHLSDLGNSFVASGLVPYIESIDERQPSSTRP